MFAEAANRIRHWQPSEGLAQDADLGLRDGCAGGHDHRMMARTRGQEQSGGNGGRTMRKEVRGRLYEEMNQ